MVEILHAVGRPLYQRLVQRTYLEARETSEIDPGQQFLVVSKTPLILCGDGRQLPTAAKTKSQSLQSRN
jgi:hypothetical protein